MNWIRNEARMGHNLVQRSYLHPSYINNYQNKQQKNDIKQKASQTRTESRLSNFSDNLVQLPVLTQDGREDTAVKNDFVRKLDFKTCICV